MDAPYIYDGGRQEGEAVCWETPDHEVAVVRAQMAYDGRKCVMEVDDEGQLLLSIV